MTCVVFEYVVYGCTSEHLDLHAFLGTYLTSYPVLKRVWYLRYHAGEFTDCIEPVLNWGYPLMLGAWILFTY